MARKPADITYGVDDRPPLAKLIGLGAQHVILMGVYLVIVVIVLRAAGASDDIASNAVRLSLIALAIATAIQAIKKGPIGSGFLAAPVVSAIYLDPSIEAAKHFGLAAVFAMTMYAGILEIILSRFLYYLRAVFPPGVCGFIIVAVGIQLGMVGVQHAFGIQLTTSANETLHLIVAGVTLLTTVGLSIWWRGTIRLMCSFIAIVVGFVLAYVIGLIPASQLQQLHQAHWLAIPNPDFISYQFEPSLIVPFTIAAIAATLRTIGVVTTCQKINDLDWRRPDMKSIKGGVLADGIGCFLAGLLGNVGINTGPSLVGVSKATGATSRYIGFASAGILILLAFVPKIIALILIMPMAVIGAALMFTGSFMIIGGIQIITSRNIDTRMTFVVGLSLLIGLSRLIFPDFYQGLPSWLQSFTSSMLATAIVSAILLNLIFRLGIRMKASMRLDGENISIKELEKFIISRKETWNVPQDVIERVLASTKTVMKYIQDLRLAENEITAAVAYDQIDFEVKVHYQGELLSLPYVGQNRTVFVEEESFSYGLADFWSGVYPDTFKYSTTNKQVEIILAFHI